MPKITAIQAQKKNPNRVNIYLDEQFAFGLSRFVAAWLQVGQTLTEEKAASLLAQDAAEVAMQQALRFLGYRPRSAHEVEQYLQEKETPPSVIETTLRRLTETGLLNDSQFASAWVENRSTFRPRSHRALALELRRKGLGDAEIAQALQASAPEEELALDAARKVLRKYKHLDWLNFRARLGGFLGRRGFSYAVSAATLRRVWQEMNEGEEQDLTPDYDDNEEDK